MESQLKLWLKKQGYSAPLGSCGSRMPQLDFARIFLCRHSRGQYWAISEYLSQTFILQCTELVAEYRLSGCRGYFEDILRSFILPVSFHCVELTLGKQNIPIIEPEIKIKGPQPLLVAMIPSIEQRRSLTKSPIKQHPFSFHLQSDEELHEKQNAGTGLG